LVGLLGQPTSGTQNAGEPKAYEGGQRGVQGAQAPWRGVVGVCPQKPQKENSRPLWQPRHEWGPKRWQTLSPRGRENGGSRGAKPPGRGFGGCAPKNLKRGRVAHLSNPATSGTQNSGEPSAHGGGQTGGPGGRSPHGRRFWGMCPQKPQKGTSSPP
jgi:hypothetical protein